MHRATLPRFILTHRLACSHLTLPRSNTPMPTRTITRTWSLASRNHRSPFAVLSNHLLDGRQCRSCKLDILWLWMDLFHVFSRRMMGRYNFLRSKLSRSISWERRQCLLVPINLRIPVSLFYSFFEYFRVISFYWKPHRLRWSGKGSSLISARQLLAHSRRQESQTPRRRLLLYLDLSQHLYIIY